MPPTRSAKMTALNQSARDAAKAMASCHRMIKASLCHVRFTCGKPSCRCAKGKRFRHEAWTFTYKHKGRSMGLHVPKNMEAEARRAADDYQKLKKLVQRLSNSNLKKFRLARARRASRRKIAVMKAKSRRKSHT